jgi:hypothetical protein
MNANQTLSISILACILGICFVSTAWAQQPATMPPMGVNNFGIAVGTYGIGDNPEQAAAVAIH